ncbi:MAG: ROK family protein [Chloroflexota bacterium]
MAIGVEVGTRGLRAAICDKQGDVLDSLHNISALPNAHTAVDTIFDLVEQLLDRHDDMREHIAGIGVAFGGPVDTNRGITLGSPRIAGFEQFPLAGLLEDRFRIPVLVENDARAAALGEFDHGAGRGSQSMIYMQLGIGVGGGVIINGELHHGLAMTAGEFGHIPVSTDGPRCSCGKPGHLEAYVSETAVMSRMRECLDRSNGSPSSTPGTVHNITIEEIFSHTDSDECAEVVAGDAIRMIGLALAGMISALSFDAVVLGGYANLLGTPFIARVRSRIRQYAFDPPGRRVSVSHGQLGNDAAIVGSTTLVLRTRSTVRT